MNWRFDSCQYQLRCSENKIHAKWIISLQILCLKFIFLVCLAILLNFKFVSLNCTDSQNCHSTQTTLSNSFLEKCLLVNYNESISSLFSRTGFYWIIVLSFCMQALMPNSFYCFMPFYQYSDSEGKLCTHAHTTYYTHT